LVSEQTTHLVWWWVGLRKLRRLKQHWEFGLSNDFAEDGSADTGFTVSTDINADAARR
jgi:hypothetical protein